MKTNKILADLVRTLEPGESILPSPDQRLYVAILRSQRDTADGPLIDNALLTEAYLSYGASVIRGDQRRQMDRMELSARKRARMAERDRHRSLESE